MKKLLFIATIAVLGLSNINAQGVKFGAKTGLNIATAIGDNTDGVESRTSFHVGGVAEISISEKFSFQPELLYSAQGAKQTVEGIELIAKYDYINLPLMAKYYVADGFSLEAGPQVGFLVSAKQAATVQGIDIEVDAKDFVKSVDFGLNFGLGYKLVNGLNFSARYNLGLSNVNDIDEPIDGFENVDDKNQNSVFQISVGYFF